MGSERNNELLRLKKEYHSLVKKELSKMKKDIGDFSSDFTKHHHHSTSSKSPDRTFYG